MTTYAVTPTLFVGVESPTGISPVYNLTAQGLHTDDVVAQALDILGADWDEGHRPAVVVPDSNVAFRILRGLGLSPDDARERCRFPLRMWLGGPT